MCVLFVVFSTISGFGFGRRPLKCAGTMGAKWPIVTGDGCLCVRVIVPVSFRFGILMLCDRVVMAKNYYEETEHHIASIKTAKKLILVCKACGSNAAYLCYAFADKLCVNAVT